MNESASFRCRLITHSPRYTDHAALQKHFVPEDDGVHLDFIASNLGEPFWVALDKTHAHAKYANDQSGQESDLKLDQYIEVIKNKAKTGGADELTTNPSSEIADRLKQIIVPYQDSYITLAILEPLNPMHKAWNAFRFYEIMQETISKKIPFYEYVPHFLRKTNKGIGNMQNSGFSKKPKFSYLENVLPYKRSDSIIYNMHHLEKISPRESAFYALMRAMSSRRYYVDRTCGNTASAHEEGKQYNSKIKNDYFLSIAGLIRIGIHHAKTSRRNFIQSKVNTLLTSLKSNVIDFIDNESSPDFWHTEFKPKFKKKLIALLSDDEASWIKPVDIDKTLIYQCVDDFFEDHFYDLEKQGGAA